MIFDFEKKRRSQKICEKSFSICFELQSIFIPNNSNPSIIESNAFALSSIQEITIPSKVSNLEKKKYGMMNCTN